LGEEYRSFSSSLCNLLHSQCYTYILHKGLWSWQALKFWNIKEPTCFIKMLVCNAV
jgi:hypothetical protein